MEDSLGPANIELANAEQLDDDLVEADQPDGEAHSDEGPIFVARAALAVIRLPRESEPMFVGPEARRVSTEVEDLLRRALKDDARVVEVYDDAPRFDIDNARTWSFCEVDRQESDLAESIETYEGLSMNSTIVFRVRVPAKNQPKYRNMDDVPADEYLVAWNGVALVVQWEQETLRATGSGGHIVFDILEDAGVAAGHKVEILACSPGCRHRFVHGDFVTFTEPPTDHFHVAGSTPTGSSIFVPYPRSDDDRANLARTFSSIANPLHTFGETQATSNLLLYLADRARRDSAEMLELSYARAARRRLPDIAGTVVDLWHLRNYRDSTRRLIAGIWLALAMIDYHLSTFERSYARFQEALTERGLVDVERFLDTNEAAISGLNLSQVRASLQETASRMEGKLLILATFAGAMAAVAGAALVAILT